MKLMINGETFDFEEGNNVDQLLEQLKLTPQQVIVELNRNILKAEVFSATFLTEGDELEVVQFVGGG